jgi:hypothetical protein
MQLWAYEVLGLHPPETRHPDPDVIPRALCWGEGFRYGGLARGNIHVLRASLDRLPASLVRSKFSHALKLVFDLLIIMHLIINA